jgi:hypothetical protein
MEPQPKYFPWLMQAFSQSNTQVAQGKPSFQNCCLHKSKAFIKTDYVVSTETIIMNQTIVITYYCINSVYVDSLFSKNPRSLHMLHQLN